MIVAALGVRAFEIFQCQGIYKMGRQFGEPRMVLVDDEAALVPGPRMHAPLGALEVDDVLGIENVFAEFRHFFFSGRGRVRAEEEIPGLECPLRAARRGMYDHVVRRARQHEHAGVGKNSVVAAF